MFQNHQAYQIKKRKGSEAVTTEVTVEASSSSIGNILGTENNSIDVNICCMCFESYDNEAMELNG